MERVSLENTPTSVRTIRVKDFAGVKWLLEEPPEDIQRCPRCGAPVDLFRGTLKLDKEYEVWQIPICENCVQEVNSPHISLSDRLAAAGLIGKLQGMTLDGFKVENQCQDRGKRAAVRYVADPTTNLWLYGASGTGKTHLAAAIARSLIGSGRTIGLFYVPTLLDELRDSYRYGSDPVLEQLECARVDILVLDDLGVEKRTDWATERLNTVINYRNVHNKPTIVTSNFAPDELAEHLDDRLVSRLMDTGRAVSLGDEDWRIRKTRKSKK